jgi:hypothetical protein
MKKHLFAAMAVAIALLTCGAVGAEELWSPHLRGVDEACPAGALPPQGVYFIDNNYFATMTYYDGKSKATPLRLDAYINVPILLWNPGRKVLKADYAVALIKPFDYLSLSSGTTPMLSNGHLAFYNTVLVPAILSWKAKHDLHIEACLATYLNDATFTPAHPASNNGVGSGNSYTTIEPGLGICWLHNGWDIGAGLRYDYMIKDFSTDYKSGDEISIDYTAVKTTKKWTVGLVAFQTNQLEDDNIKGVDTPGTIRYDYGAGPMVGYDFGPITAQAMFNYNIKTQNDFGANFLNVRFLIPLK